MRAAVWLCCSLALVAAAGSAEAAESRPPEGEWLLMPGAVAPVLTLAGQVVDLRRGEYGPEVAGYLDRTDPTDVVLGLVPKDVVAGVAGAYLIDDPDGLAGPYLNQWVLVTGDGYEDRGMGGITVTKIEPLPPDPASGR
jgi:hypothetical protein